MNRLSRPGKTRIGLIRFPGSNCDADCIDSLRRHFSLDTTLISHRATELPPLDAVILPGGFSYGDYVRAGALAALNPIMKEVAAFHRRGGAVMGICNGFQILCETQLLPGALLDNASGRFVCRWAPLAFERRAHRVINLPIAHGQGRFFASPETLNRLEGNGQVLLRYVGESPNGSLANIAGMTSEDGKIWGMMPHPERACDDLLGGTGGLFVWESFLNEVVGRNL